VWVALTLLAVFGCAALAESPKENNAASTETGSLLQLQSGAAAEVSAENSKPNPRGKGHGKDKAHKDLALFRRKKIVDDSQDACLLCQYIVERISNNVHWTGVLPQKRGRPDREGRDKFSIDSRYDENISGAEARQMDEVEKTKQRYASFKKGMIKGEPPGGKPKAPAFLDLASEIRAKMMSLHSSREDDPSLPGSSFGAPSSSSSSSSSSSAAPKGKASAEQPPPAKNPNYPNPYSVVNLEGVPEGVVGSPFPYNYQFGVPYKYGGALNGPTLPIDTTQPNYRQYFNSLEHQKYSEVFHISDLTLDHVCEEGMPNEFYKHCRSVFNEQSTIVSLLLRQYSASTICLRVRMCSPMSYMTRGIHTPPARAT